MYNPIDDAIRAALSNIVGPENVLTSPDSLEAYSHDETAGLRFAPEVVARVSSVEQVSAILQLAQRERVPVTPRGAGTGLSGGAVPAHGHLIWRKRKKAIGPERYLRHR